jgi:hypothetical protein
MSVGSTGMHKCLDFVQSPMFEIQVTTQRFKGQDQSLSSGNRVLERPTQAGTTGTLFQTSEPTR